MRSVCTVRPRQGVGYSVLWAPFVVPSPPGGGLVQPSLFGDSDASVGLCLSRLVTSWSSVHTKSRSTELSLRLFSGAQHFFIFYFLSCLTQMKKIHCKERTQKNSRHPMDGNSFL